MDLNLFKTRMGMIIISTAIADDTIGWIVLSITAGLATGGLASGGVVRTVLLTVGFVALAFTVGKFAVRKAMMFSAQKLKMPHPQVSMMLLLVFAFGAITQAIGVHLVLGAFVAAILIGRFRKIDPTAIAGVRQVGMGFFVPYSSPTPESRSTSPPCAEARLLSRSLPCSSLVSPRSSEAPWGPGPADCRNGKPSVSASASTPAAPWSSLSPQLAFRSGFWSRQHTP
jgi:hypothetical protein